MYMLYHIYISTVFLSGELLVSKFPRSDQVPKKYFQVSHLSIYDLGLPKTINISRC